MPTSTKQNGYHQHDDDVVIAGVSGKFPESENIEEFKKNLFDGVDMVTDDERRWPTGIHGLPARTGKLKTLDHFDATFFGVHAKQAHAMDPQLRLLLELTYEAIVDAGYNPNKMKGSNTGVFVGASTSETEEFWGLDPETLNGYALTGCCRAMFPNRISYTFDFKGPSYAVDTACSSSMFALHQAVKAIRTGECEAAVVAGVNLCLKPASSVNFNKLSMLSTEGKCKAFEKSGNGYVRAEAAAVIFLQKAKNARRVYATVLNTKCNTDGAKVQGITFPSGDMQNRLIKEVYEESKINKNDVVYVEAHGTGTKVGDPQEVNSIVNYFCENRKTPLLIGSVKSNMGHSEPASGLCSIAKILIAMESGVIPGNLHFKEPNTDIPGLLDGRLKVVDKNTPWNGGIVAVNSFGFGGANAHVVLKSNPVNKQTSFPTETIPRLITVSGRNEKAVDTLLDFAEKNPHDPEFYAMLHKVHKNHIAGHNYRGYTILGNPNSRETTQINGEKRPIWFIFSGMGSQWPGMAKDMMKIPVFRQTIEKCAAALKQFNIDLVELVTNGTETTFENVVNSFLSIAAVQVALVDLLFFIGVEPDGIVGHSVGEVGCAYADRTFTAEQAVLAAYWRGRSILDSKVPKGAMAAVGMSWEDCLEKCPSNISPACHNSADSVTISGPPEDISNFVKTLQSKEIFAKEVKSSGVAFHSKYISDAAPMLKKSLDMVITNPLPRSSKWISSSIPQSKWNTPLAKMSSSEYHVNNLLSPVLFHEALQHVPENAIVIEIAPHCLLQAVLKRSLPNTCTNVGLMKRDHENNMQFMLSSVGKLYSAGAEPNISNLYPHVTFPVSRGTPMLASLVEWDHSQEYSVAYFGDSGSKSGEIVFEFDLSKSEDDFISGHTIDGRVLFPATGYMTLAWKALAKLKKKNFDELPVVMENLQFHRATIMPKDGSVKFSVNILNGSGDFEINEGGSVAVSGRIYVPEDITKEQLDLPLPPTAKNTQDILPLQLPDVYKDLRLRGYDYSGIFRGIKTSDNYGTTGSLNWENNWISFVDTMLQFGIISSPTRELYLPTRLQKAIIDPRKHMDMLQQLNEGSLPVYQYKSINIVKSGGVELRGVKTSLAPRRQQSQASPKLEKFVFTPYTCDRNKEMSKENALTTTLQIAIENTSMIKMKVIEIANDRPAEALLSPLTMDILESEPMLRADITVVASNKTAAHNQILDPLSIKISSKDVTKVVPDQNCHLVIGADIISRQNGDVLKNMCGALIPGGVILLEEIRGCFDNPANMSFLDKFNLEIVSQQMSPNNIYLLLRTKTEVSAVPYVIYVTENNFVWVEEIKRALKFSETHFNKIYLVCEKETTTGVVGMVNCLRQEAGGNNIRLFFIQDNNVEKFDLASEFYQNQLKKDLVMNVMKDGQWGSYRHIRLNQNSDSAMLQVEHAYINALARGDLASLHWIEGPLTYYNEEKLKPNEQLCHVYYAPLNFRDIMLATGKLPPDALPGDLAGQDCILGLEFAGRTQNGERVMGMVAARGLATTVLADKGFMWKVPEKWTFEQASTVPVVYSTAYYALIVRGNMKKGDSLLVHAGTGGVGLAAISIALHMGVTVYTTVGTKEKREFLKKTFPQLTDSNIGNSRDTSFEQLVLNQTCGRGVDLVLNSLAEDKLQASIRCLAIGGRFLEIGKYDLSNNTPLGMAVFLKNTTFHGILLDALFDTDCPDKREVVRLVTEGMENGAVRPLPCTVYSEQQIEQAFRYMATGKHIGKVVLKIRQEESAKVFQPTFKTVNAIPRPYMHSDKSYVLAGGLGGFGLELAQWLITRGATKIVLTSRSGLKTGYQSLCVRRWRESGIKVLVSTGDCTTLEGAQKLLKDANQLGPVGGIFNLAAVLRDAFMENQSEADFKTVCRPKVDGTKYLDIASRTLCPEIDYFVAFSSVSCGRGNAGQANYGLANSAMERICEARQSAGLPALAIQWGAIGDVGLVLETMGDNETVVGGTLPQRMSSCLSAMSTMLNLPHPVIASMVLADKNRGKNLNANQDVTQTVANILGIKDAKKVPLATNLADLGMDSLMGAEIKQMLERNYDLVLGVQEIRNLTFSKLHELSGGDTPAELSNVEEKIVDENPQAQFTNVELMPKQVIVKMPSKAPKFTDQTPIFLVHPIEGSVELLQAVSKEMSRPVYGIQCTKDAPLTSMGDLSDFYIRQIRTVQPYGPYIITGYSFGACVAFEMALQLEKTGDKVELVLIDGSPSYVTTHTGNHKAKRENTTDNSNEADALCYFAMLFKDIDQIKITNEMQNMKSWDDRLLYTTELLKSSTPYLASQLADAARSFYYKLVAADKYQPSSTFKGQTTLFRAKDNFVAVDKDYGLTAICNKPVNIHDLDGNHRSILQGKSAMTIAKTIEGAANRV